MRFYLRALSYFRDDWRLILLWLWLLGLSTALSLLGAWPMAILLDSVLAQSQATDLLHRFFLAMLPRERSGQILALAAISFGLKFLQDLLVALQGVLCNQINNRGLLRVRCDLYRKLQSLSLGYHRSQPQGDAIYRLSSDTFGCQTILGVLVNTAAAAGTLVGMTLLLASRSLSLTLLAFSIAPVLAIVNITFGKRFLRQTRECKQRDASFTTVVQRAMACIGLVQSYGREADEFRQFAGTVEDVLGASWRLNREQIAYNLLVGAVFGIGGASVFGVGGWLVYRDQILHHGAAGLTAGDLVVFTSYLGMLYGPLCSLTGFFYNLQGGVAGAQRVFEVLDRDPVIVDRPDAQSLPRGHRTLELKKVHFAYADDRPILQGLSLRVEPGQMVALVGSSGVGKSTLLNLLPRFYDPRCGTISLDGVDLRDVKISDLRKHFSLVLQDHLILAGTVAENIAYGRPRATFEQIREAASMAGAAKFIESLPKGYETPLTEGGQNLSGGQRQRISIARAFLTEAPIIVLDEPSSALDAHHERKLVETLCDLRGRRTLIIVSHRLQTVMECDRIYVIEAGKVAEAGTHDELLALRGLYHDMALHQRLTTASRAAA